MPMIASLLLTLSASATAAPSSGLSPEQRDTECLVALKAERKLGPLRDPAEAYFASRISRIADPELRELLLLSAQEAIGPNRNRREIASTCVLLYQVLSLQEKQATASAKADAVGPQIPPG